MARTNRCALQMSDKDKDDDKTTEENPDDLWMKMTAGFREEGKGGVFEQAMNYFVDLFTVTAGAAVAMCLLFNVLGKIPCI
mmetsp:Transcript_47066/g.94321  ORF Transcript_47066/g.94321 Transcript_47066/m.94321 type:complete len:81 (-) Transcript_47066:96-338(-)